MNKKFVDKFLSPLNYLRTKNRPWRRRRHALERRVLESEKVTGLLIKLYAWDVRGKILSGSRYMVGKCL